MDQTELAYLAGLFDGEGCIFIQKLNKQRGFITSRYRLTVQITNTCESIMMWFKSQGWYVLERKKMKKEWKRCWVGKLHDRNASRFLESVLLYLRVKRDEAEVALEFQKHKDEEPINGRNGLTSIEIEYREKLKRRLSELKEQKI